VVGRERGGGGRGRDFVLTTQIVVRARRETKVI
jgi:hypothetical protein